MNNPNMSDHLIDPMEQGTVIDHLGMAYSINTNPMVVKKLPRSPNVENPLDREKRLRIETIQRQFGAEFSSN